MKCAHVPSEDAFRAAIIQASTVEEKAWELEGELDLLNACAAYRASTAKLNLALMKWAPHHHPDIKTITTHILHLHQRVEYLQDHGFEDALPIEHHIKTFRLKMKGILCR